MTLSLVPVSTASADDERVADRRAAPRLDAIGRRETDAIRAAAIAARRAELLSVKEFSTVVRVHPLTVYRWIREGTLSGVYRFGKEIRIDLVRAERTIDNAHRQA